MPLNLQPNLPAIELLKREHIFVMDQLRAKSQDIRPLKIAVLNLMPLKIDTETDLIRILSNTPLQVEIDFVALSTHQSKNTPLEHMKTFYKSFETVSQKNYDGLIVTGAPVENLDYEAVSYWDEVAGIFNWARTHVTSTFYICWAAQAALYHFYGIPKYPLPSKMFGVFPHMLLNANHCLFRGFDGEFYAPHSRHTEVRAGDIQKHADLELLSVSDEAGVYVVAGRGGREFYVTGHSEYALGTLHNEYSRDLKKGMHIEIPKNYYKDDNPAMGPVSRWTAHGNLLYMNWLNYFVYQATPYDPEAIARLGVLNFDSENFI